MMILYNVLIGYILISFGYSIYMIIEQINRVKRGVSIDVYPNRLLVVLGLLWLPMLMVTIRDVVSKWTH